MILCSVWQQSKRWLIALSFLLTSLVTIPQSFAAPPSGFAQQLVIGGLNLPTDIAFAPDGRIFIAQQQGKVMVYKNGQLLATPALDMVVGGGGDRGLLSLTFDPNFSVNHYVYLFYTSNALHQRVSRFVVNGDTIAPASETVLIENPSTWGGFLNAGAVRFGPDGKLYATFGSDGKGLTAQDLSALEGKMIRINSDGSIPADNPFVATPGAQKSIYAMGFRNPWRFHFDETGHAIVGDVGQSLYEKVVRVFAGANYGWPTVEGDCRPSCGNITPPLFVIAHNGQGTAVVGGDVYRAQGFPAAYQHLYFYGDYVQGTVKTISIDAAGNVGTPQLFDNQAGVLSEIAVGPDACLYQLTIFPGQLFKTCYNGGGAGVLSAKVSADKTSGPLNLTANFTGSGSNDSTGLPLTYSWNFGDGGTGSGPNPAHTYTTKGVYKVTLTISNVDGTASANMTIWAGYLPPTVTISAPIAESKYTAGNTIHYAGTATDPQDGALPTTAYFWKIVPHHNTHIHTPVENQGVVSGNFTIPTDGESDPNTWFVFQLIATDSVGLSTTAEVPIRPNVATINLTSTPSGATLLLDGQPHQTPYQVLSVAGIQRTVGLASPQLINGANYAFGAWSDGGGQTHTIFSPTVDKTYAVSLTQVTTAPCDTPATNAFTACYYDNMDLTNLKLMRTDPQINFDWGGGSPDPTVQVGTYSATYTGNFSFDATNYDFTATADDGVRVFLDGTLIIDHWVDEAPTTYTITKAMTAGTHLVRLEYYQNGGGASIKFAWTKNGSTPPPPATCGTPGTNAFTSCYYQGMQFQTLKLTRTDAQLNFNWNGAQPDPAVPANQFSLRSQGNFAFDAGSYTFTATADDGVRVYLDGNLIIDHFIDQPATTYTSTQTLTAGTHLITVEYYQNGGGATLKVSWAKNGSATPPPPPPPPATCGTPGTNAFTSCYYDGMQFQTLKLTRTDPQLNFDWAGGSPDPTVPTDHFSLRSQGNFTFQSGDYQFSTTADDGVRVYVDGNLIIDKWLDEAATTYTATKTMTAGTHLVAFEYFEDGGNAVAKLSWASAVTPPPPPPSILNCGTPGTNAFTSCYYDGMQFQTLKLTRTDPQLNFDWAGGSPDPTVPTDHFSLRSQGNFTFQSGDYQFSTTADDGVRVYVDGNLIIDKWLDEAATTYTATKTMTAGTHLVTFEYFEDGGNAVAKLSWASTGTPPPPPTDTVPPAVSLAAPLMNAVVSGSVPVQTIVSDNVGVVGVQFLLDGNPLGAEVTAPPFGINWDSTLAGNGPHLLAARARDAAGNQTTSTAIAVTVSNTIVPPPPPPVGLSFVVTASLPATSFPAGASTAVTTQIAATNNVPNVTIDTEIYRNDGTLISQNVVPTSLQANQLFTTNWNTTLPAVNGTYVVKVGVFSADYTTLYFWKNSAFLFTVGTPAGPPDPSKTYSINILTPQDNGTVSGVSEIQAVIPGVDINTYNISWRTGDGAFFNLDTEPVAQAYKHAWIDFGPWNWLPDGIYPLEFQATDQQNHVIGDQLIHIHVTPPTGGH